MRTHYLRDARVETVSECGRYLIVSGVRAWGKNRLRFSVMATDARHHRAIATVECRIAFAAARAEKKIRAIKSAHEAAVGPGKTNLLPQVRHCMSCLFRWDQETCKACRAIQPDEMRFFVARTDTKPCALCGKPRPKGYSNFCEECSALPRDDYGFPVPNGELNGRRDNNKTRGVA
jgi:hypothetical protein